MSGSHAPILVLLAGPNGAGKSTVAPLLLNGTLGVTEFANADLIALGLSGFAPEQAALSAGRALLARVKELGRRRVSFAFETTLASRSLAPWIRALIADGYEFHLVFLWLRSAEVAIARVADRVRMGGHDVAETTIRRRYRAGIRNFFGLYRGMTTTWALYDNSSSTTDSIRLIASGEGGGVSRRGDAALWAHLNEEYGHAD